MKRATALLFLGILAMAGGYGLARNADAADKADDGSRPIGHAVYFSLRVASAEARKTLEDACVKHLAPTPGTLIFSVGSRGEPTGAIQDKDFDVALFILFEDQKALDNYDASTAHQTFIRENRANWKKVRVFDWGVDRGSLKK